LAKGDFCVYCKLKNLFLEYQFNDSDQIPPNAVRKTLAVIYQPEAKFQLNSMDDAAECLEAILQQIHNDLTKDSEHNHLQSAVCNSPCLAHSIFGTSVLEQSICSCGTTSEPLSYSSFLQYFNVDELKEMWNSVTNQEEIPFGWEKQTTELGVPYYIDHVNKTTCWELPKKTQPTTPKDYSFSFLLQAVAINNLVTCRNEKCGKRNPVFRTLLNHPKAIALGFTWSKLNPGAEAISEILNLVQPIIDLKMMFNYAPDDADPALMELRGLVSYYGQHYVAFNFSPSFQTWLLFDDSKVIDIGPTFNDLKTKCLKSCYQPSVLFYELVS